MLSYLQTNWIEVTGTILSLIYLYLSVKQKIGLWIFGFLCSAMYVVVFFQSKFYADMSLQFYYLGVSIYGWINWKRALSSTGKELPITRTSTKQALYLALAAGLIFAGYLFVLLNFTDSPLPKSDSFTTALSIVATWMLARKMLENWLLWIVVDAVSCGLYVYKELYPTAILFAIYTVMAVIGYWQWKKAMNKVKS
jgi:nicotinamide mononucleotide transporter